MDAQFSLYVVSVWRNSAVDNILHINGDVTKAYFIPFLLQQTQHMVDQASVPLADYHGLL